MDGWMDGWWVVFKVSLIEARFLLNFVNIFLLENPLMVINCFKMILSSSL